MFQTFLITHMPQCLLALARLWLEHNLFAMFPLNTLAVFLILLIFSPPSQSASDHVEHCEKPSDSSSDYNCHPLNQYSKKRYILYDVNPSEGFNLRRDVYVRVAVFVKKLNDADETYDWNLVLPPWERMYHWRSQELGSQRQLSWGTFFDITSMRKYAPVLEMYDFFRELESTASNKNIAIDRVYILQNDMKMFETGDFKDKNEFVDCPEKLYRYQTIKKNQHSGHFWGYSNVTAKDIKCLVFHGTASGLRENLNPRAYRSFMFDRMEIPLHDEYGSRDYWRARRSMRYNDELYKLAADFRLNFLESQDSSDNTVRPSDWTKEKEQRNAKGGPYLAVHLRRRDFLRGRAESVPTIESAAEQLRKKMHELDLKILFVATDAEEDEYENLKNLLKDYRVYRYSPSADVKRKFKDGGVAIIDQIICSHARYFVGTHESTFTFRIQEDREIMGFPTKTTFNRLCGKKKKCSRGGQWEIVW